jgi:hypothetical protein
MLIFLTTEWIRCYDTHTDRWTMDHLEAGHIHTSLCRHSIFFCCNKSNDKSACGRWPGDGFFPRKKCQSLCFYGRKITMNFFLNNEKSKSVEWTLSTRWVYGSLSWWKMWKWNIHAQRWMPLACRSEWYLKFCLTTCFPRPIALCRSWILILFASRYGFDTWFTQRDTEARVQLHCKTRLLKSFLYETRADSIERKGGRRKWWNWLSPPVWMAI